MGYKGSGPRERLPHPPPPLILHPHYLSPLAGICCTMLQQQRYLVILLLVAFSFCIHLQPAASSLSSQDEQERGVIAIHHHTNPNGRPRMGIARRLQSTEMSESTLISKDGATLVSWVGLLESFPGNIALRQNWTSSNASAISPCAWKGVQCANNRITRLYLGQQNLSGPMPMGLGNLTSLTHLLMPSNSFNGSIPADVGNCTNLQMLNLSSNKFSDAPPGLFANCQQWKSFDASNNSLHSEIPSHLGNCTNLQMLNLSINFFTDASLALFANCQTWKSFDVSNNYLKSPLIVNWLWRCRNLKKVFLSKNNLTGDLSFGNRSYQHLALTTLALDQNKFTRNISTVLDFVSASHLKYIDLSHNRFLGQIPPAIGNYQQLRILNFQTNNLSGAIPSELGQLHNLECLGLGKNNFTGTIPSSLVKCRNLYFIDISSNKLSGTFPAWLSQMLNLKFLIAFGNSFSGTFPVELVTAPTLYHMDLGYNSLSGTIPSAIGNMTLLRFLRLAHNNFTGEVPAEVGNMTSLQGLDLSENQLNGSIPPTLGNLQYLMWLQLSQNKFSGAIPSEITNCTGLLWLNLRDNQLSGEIPRDFFRVGSQPGEMFLRNQKLLQPLPMDIGECSLMKSWIPTNGYPFKEMASSLKRNACQLGWRGMMMGSTPALSYWQLSNNFLNGTIPTGSIPNSTLACIFLANNTLSGAIPLNISRNPLINLDLSNNQINGSIPDMPRINHTLQSLDLSVNNLCGKMPVYSLNNMTFLSFYNFSLNIQLEGPIPNENQFKNFNPYAYLNDTKLCQPVDLTQQKNYTMNLTMKVCNVAPSPAPAVPMRGLVESQFRGHLALVCILVSIFGAIVVVSLAASMLALVYRCKSRRREARRQQRREDFEGVNSSEAEDNWGPSDPKDDFTSFGSLKSLTYSDLVEATDNFNAANIIGDGGFGMVYKAKLACGTAVAVKKLVLDGAQGEREFRAEMDTLGRIQHENLVPLLGYCREARLRERLLIYKFLCNGSLDDWLYESEERAATLSWDRRLRIAHGTAQGLRFLHHECDPPIIHRDMKSSNILVDDAFNACLTDFGLARIMEAHKTHVSTIVAGTPGYVPPEYGCTWRATAKGDVYSFGVVMLELVTNKRPIGPDFHGLEGSNLVEWVSHLVRRNRHHEVFHPVVAQTADLTSLLRFTSLALRCTSDLHLRPSMLVVTAKLYALLVPPPADSSTEEL